MRCVICGSPDIEHKEVEEEIEKKQLKFELMGKVLKVAGGDVKIKA